MKILVILGPTSTGKTDLALNLAKKFNGELVSCDSRQVYKSLDIGTGKMPSSGQLKKGKGFWEINGIKVWLYDIVDPLVQYTVANYVKDATKVVRGIQEKARLPILVGGTGLYLKALLYGLSHLSIPVDGKLRKELNQLTLDQLQKRLKEVSSKRWKSMNYSDRQNPRRLIRAIELEGGYTNKINKGNTGLANESNVLKIGLTAPRRILYERSDKRVVSRIMQGMVEEAEILNKEGLTLKRMKQLGLEYGVLADYLEEKIKTRNELIKILQNKIHGYIRRQLTWFVKEKNIFWFDIENKKFPDRVEKLILKWYDSSI